MSYIANQNRCQVDYNHITHAGIYRYVIREKMPVDLN